MLAALAVTPAHADVNVFTISPPATIPDPLSAGFTVNYTLGGSSVLASAQLTFFLSTTRNGSSGVFTLFSRQLLLSSNGHGLFLPPSGPQSQFMSQFSLDPNGLAAMQAIAAACQPQAWFIIARVDFGTIQGSTTSLIGTVKQPDFLFTSGTISPTTIQPGGTTNISFDLFTQCPVNSFSRVGVFLADANFNLLSFIGAVTIGTGAGTFSVSPIGITFAATTPPANYNLVLIADVDGVIAESNETNNAGSFALTVAPALQSTTAERPGELQLDAALPADGPSALRAVEGNPATDYITRFSER
jgi:hypothetical protein